MIFKCIAIDDEPIALEIIKQFCQRLGNTELSVFTNPLVGFDHIKKIKPDVLFLDIEMGGVNGLVLAKELPQGTFLILTTAYAQYAIDGFDLNALDFLHKPFSYARFQKAMKKAADLKNLHNMSASPILTDDNITVKVEYKNKNILLADILYVESHDNYVCIHLIHNHSFLSQMSMKSMIEMLPKDKFIRAHKSFIVPVHRIATYNSKQITLYDGQVIPVGRRYRENLK